MTKISIIVPVYNVEKYLTRCVESLLCQSFKDYEIILVDDGSPDNSGKLCDEYESMDQRIRVIHQDNKGLSGARNTGIDWVEQNSNSEWIGFVDSDDWVSERYLEALINAAESFNADMSLCEYIKTSGEMAEIDNSKLNGEVINVEDFYINHVVTATTAWGKIYKRDMFTDARFPLGRLHEDEFVTYKILFNCHKVVYIEQPLYYYFQNPEGIMLSKWNPRRMDVFDAFDEQAEFFEQYPAVHKYQGFRYLWNLNNTLKIIGNNSAYTEYKNTIHKRLKKKLWQYRKEIPWNSISYIAETEYPNYMRLYWIVIAQYNKIKKLISK